VYTLQITFLPCFWSLIRNRLVAFLDMSHLIFLIHRICSFKQPKVCWFQHQLYFWYTSL